MKLFYKAVTGEGKILSGIIEANDIRDAAYYLRSKELFPITITKKENNRLLSMLPFFSNKVRRKDILVFTRQLSLMLVSGLTLVKSLDILKNQATNEAMREIIDGVITDIQEGLSFSKALLKHPDMFSTVYVSIIKASEASGLLDKSLIRLADNLEKEQKLRGTIKAAFTYPTIVVIMMIVVVFIMMIFVIPKLTDLYKDLNVELPLATKIVVSMSHLTVAFWPIILGAGVLFSFLLRRLSKTEEGKMLIDNLVLKLPILAPIIKKTILAEFSRTLGLLIGSGTLVVESLAETADIAGNVHFKNAILDTSRRVEKGVTVGDALSVYTLFPPILIQLVKVGEQTGKLDETLLKASEYFEGEIDQAVKTLTTAMEPLIMVTLGVGVGFLIFSIITPIYKLTSSIQ
ncbi:MAG: type II secretion system F family protein [Patescibacteria group bacterium]